MDSFTLYFLYQWTGLQVTCSLKIMDVWIIYSRPNVRINDKFTYIDLPIEPYLKTPLTLMHAWHGLHIVIYYKCTFIYIFVVFQRMGSLKSRTWYSRGWGKQCMRLWRYKMGGLGNGLKRIFLISSVWCWDPVGFFYHLESVEWRLGFYVCLRKGPDPC